MDAKIERRGVLGSSLLNRLAQLGLFFFRKRADAAARQAVAGTQVEFRSLQHPCPPCADCALGRRQPSKTC